MPLLSDLTLQTSPNALLLIPDSVISELESHRQLNAVDGEQGGVIVGLIRPPHLEVTDITLPQESDDSSRFEFKRCSEKHIEIVCKKWQESNEFKTYLGEWHTHPEDIPSPSCKDIREWRRIFRGRNNIVLIIIGRKSNWYGLWKQGRPIKLNR